MFMILAFISSFYVSVRGMTQALGRSEVCADLTNCRSPWLLSHCFSIGNIVIRGYTVLPYAVL